MATIINHNIEAMNSYRNIFQTNLSMAKSLERLSSGYRINRASDDAAGLAISEKMRAQISGLNSALRNAQDGISMIRTAEGALAEMSADLIRMRELAVLASSDILTSSDRQNYQDEFRQLQQHIGRIADTTEFNTKILFNGSLSAADGVGNVSNGHVTIQVGANMGQSVSFGVVSLGLGTTYDFTANPNTGISARMMNTGTGFRADFIGGLNISYVAIGGTAATGQTNFVNITKYGSTVCIAADGAISVSTVTQATTSLWRIDQAIEKVAAVRAKLGAIENAMNSVMNSLMVNAENLQAAESRIRDTDMAKEMTNFTRNQIMMQAGMAMLAQANVMPSYALSLLQ